MPHDIDFDNETRDTAAALVGGANGDEIRRRGRCRLETDKIIILAKRLENVGNQNGIQALIDKARQLIQGIL